MPTISVLIKPVSGNCNLSCQYCFYHDETSKRTQRSYGMMSEETIESVIKAALEYASGRCTFCFQGGEPMLAGLAFFNNVVELEKRFNIHNITIDNAIQTNGTLITDDWAQFFVKNHFLIGVSLDGYDSLHNLYRRDTNGLETHKEIMKNIKLLQKHDAEFNILTVVTAQTAKNIAKVYRFFRHSGFNYQQYIPCLDPIGEKRGGHKYSLSPELYLRFLRTLFDLWITDIANGEFVYIRYFDNLMAMLLRQPPENCGNRGVCSPQFAIEADGSVFPCDFYMLDEYRLGNVKENNFMEIEEARRKSGFIHYSSYLCDECMKCELLRYCRGGCRRERINGTENNSGINYYCSAYKEFLPYALAKLVDFLESC